MTSRYESSPANLRALRDRLTQAAKREGVVFGRWLQHVAVLVVTQFMAALTDDQGGPLLLVKGGASLELPGSIPASRTSKDLDAVSRVVMESVHDQLADAGEVGWEGFTAVFTPPVPFEVPGGSQTRTASRPMLTTTTKCPRRPSDSLVSRSATRCRA